jgi:hypothetical protein
MSNRGWKRYPFLRHEGPEEDFKFAIHVIGNGGEAKTQQCRF